jgi:hypothetical protein
VLGRTCRLPLSDCYKFDSFLRLSRKRWCYFLLEIPSQGPLPMDQAMARSDPTQIYILNCD